MPFEVPLSSASWSIFFARVFSLLCTLLLPALAARFIFRMMGLAISPLLSIAVNPSPGGAQDARHKAGGLLKTLLKLIVIAGCVQGLFRWGKQWMDSDVHQLMNDGWAIPQGDPYSGHDSQRAYEQYQRVTAYQRHLEKIHRSLANYFLLLDVPIFANSLEIKRAYQRISSLKNGFPGWVNNKQQAINIKAHHEAHGQLWEMLHEYSHSRLNVSEWASGKGDGVRGGQEAVEMGLKWLVDRIERLAALGTNDGSPHLRSTRPVGVGFHVSRRFVTENVFGSIYDLRLQRHLLPREVFDMGEQHFRGSNNVGIASEESCEGDDDEILINADDDELDILTSLISIIDDHCSETTPIEYSNYRNFEASLSLPCKHQILTSFICRKVYLQATANSASVSNTHSQMWKEMDACASELEVWSRAAIEAEHSNIEWLHERKMFQYATAVTKMFRGNPNAFQSHLDKAFACLHGKVGGSETSTCRMWYTLYGFEESIPTVEENQFYSSAGKDEVPFGLGSESVSSGDTLVLSYWVTHTMESYIWLLLGCFAVCHSLSGSLMRDPRHRLLLFAGPIAGIVVELLFLYEISHIRSYVDLCLLRDRFKERVAQYDVFDSQGNLQYKNESMGYVLFGEMGGYVQASLQAGILLFTGTSEEVKQIYDVVFKSNYGFTTEPYLGSPSWSFSSSNGLHLSQGVISVNPFLPLHPQYSLVQSVPLWCLFIISCIFLMKSNRRVRNILDIKEERMMEQMRDAARLRQGQGQSGIGRTSNVHPTDWESLQSDLDNPFLITTKLTSLCENAKFIRGFMRNICDQNERYLRRRAEQKQRKGEKMIEKPKEESKGD
eukprot:Nk52_evm12s151 gene=Nk52_evmTU12s151